jgi:hypothetical protein
MCIGEGRLREDSNIASKIMVPITKLSSVFYESEYQTFLTCTTDCLTMTDGWSTTFANAAVTRSFSRNLTVFEI